MISRRTVGASGGFEAGAGVVLTVAGEAGPAIDEIAFATGSAGKVVADDIGDVGGPPAAGAATDCTTGIVGAADASAEAEGGVAAREAAVA